MPGSLEGVLANIHGYGGYLARGQYNQQREMGDIQQASGAMGILAKIQAAQTERATKEALAQSGGDVEKAMQTLIQSGNIAGAHALAPVYEIARKQKRAEQFTQGMRMLNAPSGKVGGGPGGENAPAEAPQPGNAVPAVAAPTATPVDPRQGRIDKLLKIQELADNPAQVTSIQREIDRLSKEMEAKNTEPLHPIVGPDGKPVLVPRSQAVGKTPFSPSVAGAGQFTPEALRMTAEQYLTGDRQAIAGYARNATARIALQNEIQKVAKEKGWSGKDVAAQMADFAGIMSGSRTVGQRAAQIELASTEAEKMIDIVLDKSKGFERTKFVPINQALKAFETQTGQPEVKAFGAAINSLVNVYARAISPTGVPTVSDKEHAREMLAQADSPAQVQAVMDVMRQEMKAARSAPKDVRAATRAAVTGVEAPAQAPAAPAAGASIEDRLKKYK